MPFASAHSLKRGFMHYSCALICLAVGPACFVRVGWEDLSGTRGATHTPPWWDNAYASRLRITLDNAGRTALTDFPLTVLLDSSKVDFAKILPGGADPGR